MRRENRTVGGSATAIVLIGAKQFPTHPTEVQNREKQGK